MFDNALRTILRAWSCEFQEENEREVEGGIEEILMKFKRLENLFSWDQHRDIISTQFPIIEAA